MNVYIINKSRRSAVQAFITLALPFAPMLTIGLKLKVPIKVKIAQSEVQIGPTDAGIVIDDDGRFVTARLLWPIDP
jgi:hypothetical protein